MPLVEGFGDEVILLLFLFLVGVVVALAWMSTHVDSRFLVPIIILDRERFSALIHRLRGFTEQRSDEQQQSETDPSPETLPDAEEEVDGNRDEGSNFERAQEPPSLADQTYESESQRRSSMESQSDSAHRRSRDGNVDICNQTTSLTDFPVSSSAANNTSERLRSSESASRSPERRVPDAPVSNGSQSSFGYSERSSGNSGRVPEGQVQIRLQYIDGRQRMVSARLNETIGEFKRNHFSTELAGHSVVRCVMNGQELRQESSSLRSYGVRDGSVIHCLVTQARAEPVVNTADSHHFEIGFLMFPLFGFLLTLLWYARIAYRSYFSGASTCSLVAISFLYIIALIGSFRSNRLNHPHQD